MKDEAMKVKDKKDNNMFKFMRVHLKVRKFVNILKAKQAFRNKRRATIGLSSFQQAKLAVNKNDKGVELVFYSSRCFKRQSKFKDR